MTDLVGECARELMGHVVKWEYHVFMVNDPHEEYHLLIGDDVFGCVTVRPGYRITYTIQGTEIPSFLSLDETKSWVETLGRNWVMLGPEHYNDE